MKRLLILGLLINTIIGGAQSIGDLYLSIPAKYALGFSVDERKSIIDAFENKTKFKKDGEFDYRIEEFDKINGYMRITGAFEGTWEMCYWNLNDKSKLIATTMYSCGPLCSTNYIEFYYFREGQLIETTFCQIVPDCSMIDLITLAKDQTTVQAIRPLYKEPISFVYYLPRKGKNIRVEYQGLEYFDLEYLKPLLQGTILELEWTGEKFKKGRIFFE